MENNPQNNTSPLATFELLKQKFLNGITWNGIFYGAYRLLSAAKTLVLYARLDTTSFSLWANIYSLTFITILWTDLGLRKSVPRYAPYFVSNRATRNRFIYGIVLAQTALIIIISPLFMTLQYSLYPEGTRPELYTLGIILLLLEGIQAALKLIFHAQFWIKEYTLVATGALLLETLSIYFLLCFGLAQQGLVIGIIATKIVLVASAILALFLQMRMLAKKEWGKNTSEQQKSSPHLVREFVQHSCIMWANNCLKSLTERNVMVPLITTIIGQEAANLFKVANDTALTSYRFIIKTIGTTDTSLFSQVERLPDAKKLMPIAFTKVTSSIAALCLPFSGIVMLAAVFNASIFRDRLMFQIFFIIIIGYLIESLLSPFERILEVKRRYSKLLIAYSPYIIIVAITIFLTRLSWIGLGTFIVCIQGVRLVSSLIMIPYARREYALPITTIYAITLLSISLPIIIGLYVLRSVE